MSAVIFCDLCHRSIGSDDLFGCSKCVNELEKEIAALKEENEELRKMLAHEGKNYAENEEEIDSARAPYKL